MSKEARYTWHDQQAVLHERMKGFMQHPGDTELRAVLDEMRAYAEAARNGRMEIPTQFTAIGI
ncbi:MAG: hypothetical protein V4463_00685 [Pseudomonadota bacterium]